MPNWCDNSLTITASKEKIDAIEAGLKLQEKVLFQTIRPRPESEEESWYEWNVNNWGTKWEASVYDYIVQMTTPFGFRLIRHGLHR